MTSYVVVGCPVTTLRLAESFVSPELSLLTPAEYRLAGRRAEHWVPVFVGALPDPVSDDSGQDSDDSSLEHQEEQVAERRALMRTTDDALLASPAAALLRQPGRWVGLDPSVAGLTPELAQQGRAGIAMGYSDEGQGAIRPEAALPKAVVSETRRAEQHDDETDNHSEQEQEQEQEGEIGELF